MGIENNIKRPAVFLDRDGTIIEDRGHLCRPSQVKFFAGTVSALRRLNEHFELFIVTNQSGVAKGFLTLEDVGCVNGYVVSYLAEQGIRITDTYVCPHDSLDGCECIKPKPYFLKKAEKEHGIDLSRSFAVGDHPHDVAFAENAGARGIYVLSGHGMKHRNELWEDALIVAGIEEAANIICGKPARDI
ncbi:MAG: D-glycero-alpha-D-manno-heptose-1,7-bisphosphate 7-phosphatase [Desulfobacterales bacterium]